MKGNLRNGLDRQVLQVVRGLIENQGNTALNLSVPDVYDSIQRSNSSLKRQKKKILEDSVDRVLLVLQEEEQVDEQTRTDSDIEARSQSNAADSNHVPSNAMNRSIAKSMKKQANGSQHQTGASLNTDFNANASSTTKKRSVPQGEERPLKRSKTREALATAPPIHTSFKDLGGMDSIIEQLELSVLLPLQRPQRFLRRGRDIPRGILFHGPPGCGKTMLCEALANETGVSWLPIQGPSIVSGMSGESEKALRQHFEAALEAAPCLMFIDEIDAIAPKRETAQREMERRIVAQLLTCMDDLALEKTGGKPVIVLAATNRPDSLDPALRRAGRFDKEFNIGVPSVQVRESILRALTEKDEVAENVDYARLAKMTPGFVGADLKSLVYEAGWESDKRYLKALEELIEPEMQPQLDTTTTMDIDGNSNVSRMSVAGASYQAKKKLLAEVESEPLAPESDTLTMSDFLAALPRIQPSSKREGFATIPDTTWHNVGALESVRHELHNAFVAPIRNPEAYERFGISVPAGVLLWGPPGCGKTLLAKAVANESKANFISVKGPELLSKYVGESERAIRQVFFRARSSAPCVIFFDELDALAPRRDASQSEVGARVVNTLLTELDGLSDRIGIYIIAATNKPEMIDPAMLRPGRLGKLLFVGLPEEDERVEILRTIMRKMPVADHQLPEFARKCVHFSGADLSNLAYEAAQKAVQRNSRVLDLADLQDSLQGVEPSVSPADLEKYMRYKRNGISTAKV